MLVACQLRCWSPEYTAALLCKKSTLSVDATVKALSTNRLLVPAFFLSNDTEWIMRFSVSTEEHMPNLFKMVINSVEPPHDSMTSLNTAWKGELHSLLVIKIMRYQICPTEVSDTACKSAILYGCTTSLTLVHILGEFTDMIPQVRGNRLYCIYKLINIEGKLHGLITALPLLMVY